MAFRAGGVLENCLVLFSAETVLQHTALGHQHWWEDKGNGRDISLPLSFHSVSEQRLKNQCYKPQTEQGWAHFLN